MTQKQKQHWSKLKRLTTSKKTLLHVRQKFKQTKKLRLKLKEKSKKQKRQRKARKAKERKVVAKVRKEAEKAKVAVRVKAKVRLKQLVEQITNELQALTEKPNSAR